MINKNYKGKLLISSPAIAGDLFDKSVILICEHDVNGTMGFIINKPLIDINVGAIWANLGYEEKNLCSASEDVFMGGPLASNAMFVIHS
ncbi:MAG: YqgE/AlgH family protein, partial [Paracoccaceae bacterium]